MKNFDFFTWQGLTLALLLSAIATGGFAQEPPGQHGQSNSFVLNTNCIGFGECAFLMTSGISDPALSGQGIMLGNILPNPFNPRVSISFSVPEQGLVEIGVYNLAGQCIRHLVNDIFSPGEYSRQWDGRNQEGAMMPTGVYFVRLIGQTGTHSKKITLLK